MLYVTHDAAEAVALADRILLLSPAPGRVTAELAIPIPREERHDPAVQAALQRELAGLALPALAPAMVRASSVRAPH